jgi:hypothetical protein
MAQECEVTEVEIDGRSFWVRPVGSWVLESGNVVAAALAVSLDKPLGGPSGSSLETWNPVWNCGI